jgi:phosphoserine aminotransferase
MDHRQYLNPMLHFYPGPSKVYPSVRDYLTTAYDEGILNVPHRGDAFVQLSKATIAAIRKKLNIPQDYYIFFTSSATECWEILIQSLTRTSSFHVFNGSFGEKWYDYAKKLRPQAQAISFPLTELLDVNALPDEPEAELICLTQNETSNGTQLNGHTLLNLRNKYRDQLIGVDATSSMGGVNLKFILADIWFASVQKCFGLPPGLALMACSPRTIIRAKSIAEKNHYNSIVLLYDKMLNYQTSYTPNILGIYLLYRVMEQVEPIKILDHHLVERANDLYSFFEQFQDFQPLIMDPNVRSSTVITIVGADKTIDEVKKRAAQEKILVGNGYGKWARNTFRIANFPAHEDVEYDTLKTFFLSHYS